MLLANAVLAPPADMLDTGQELPLPTLLEVLP